MRTTIHDIAKASGLSPSTVSRVLTNNPHVSAEAKRKVKEAISKTGYVPNGLARGLVTRRRNLIAVIIPEESNPFYVDIQSAINEVAAQNGMSAILVTQNENDRRTTVERVLEMGIDGLALSPCLLKRERHLSFWIVICRAFKRTRFSLIIIIPVLLRPNICCPSAIGGLLMFSGRQVLFPVGISIRAMSMRFESTVFRWIASSSSAVCSLLIRAIG